MSKKKSFNGTDSDSIEIGANVRELPQRDCVVIGPGDGSMGPRRKCFSLVRGDVELLEVDFVHDTIVFRDEDGFSLLRAEWFKTGKPTVVVNGEGHAPWDLITESFRQFIRAMGVFEEPIYDEKLKARNKELSEENVSLKRRLARVESEWARHFVFEMESEDEMDGSQAMSHDEVVVLRRSIEKALDDR